jgi:diketogulonate reductase-like aldo/keto reductase
LPTRPIERIDIGGVELPALGLGTWQLSGDTCRTAVAAALETGYRAIDTAEQYGNEAAVGQAIREAAVDREDVFLMTKVWRSNLRHDDLIAAAEASRERLGVDYLDLLLVHWPHPHDHR